MGPEFPSKSNIPEERVWRAQLLGTGASNPTGVVDPGLTITRTGVGVFRCSFASNPGVLVGFFPGLGAAALKGHTVTRSALTGPSGDTQAYIDISLWNASEAADELGAAEYLDLTFVFSNSSIALT